MSDVTPKTVAVEMLKTAEHLFKKIRECSDLDQANKTFVECACFKELVQFVHFEIK